MSQSRFHDATGLNPLNVASAEDLAKMVRAASRYPVIRQFTTTTEYRILAANGRQLHYRNSNALVREGKWEIDLSKTGYIQEAGRCLVMMTRVRDQRLVMVLLDAKGGAARLRVITSYSIHYTKLYEAAALANRELGTLGPEIAERIVAACDLMLDSGRCFDQFPVDLFQGGAGTSVNMNVNEVLANLALELMDLPKGRYDVIHPNDHVNKCQSTNDAYPTGFRVALFDTTDGCLLV